MFAADNASTPYARTTANGTDGTANASGQLDVDIGRGSTIHYPIALNRAGEDAGGANAARFISTLF